MSENTGSADAGNSADNGGQQQQQVGQGSQQQADKWYSGIQDEGLRGLAELKGWDSPEKALSSYKNLEKLTGLPPERLLKIPDKDDAAGLAELNKRFGWAAPDDAKDYNIEVPEGSDNRYAEHIRGVFKELGVPKDLAEKLAKAQNTYMADLLKSEDDAYNVKAQADMAALKAEWGGEFDKLDQLGRRAAKEFGVDQTTLELMEDLLGPAGSAKFWAKIGSKMSEAAFIDGKVDQLGPLTPDAARARVQQLGQDKAWFERFEKGGIKEAQEWKQLTAIIASAANR